MQRMRLYIHFHQTEIFEFKVSVFSFVNQETLKMDIKHLCCKMENLIPSICRKMRHYIHCKLIINAHWENWKLEGYKASSVAKTKFNLPHLQQRWGIIFMFIKLFPKAHFTIYFYEQQRSNGVKDKNIRLLINREFWGPSYSK